MESALSSLILGSSSLDKDKFFKLEKLGAVIQTKDLLRGGFWDDGSFFRGARYHASNFPPHFFGVRATGSRLV